MSRAIAIALAAVLLGGCVYRGASKAPLPPVGNSPTALAAAYVETQGALIGFLATVETEFRPDGVVVVRYGLDRLALGGALGSLTSCITGQPWGVLAGAGSQIGESVSRVIAVPANLTPQAPPAAKVPPGE